MKQFSHSVFVAFLLVLGIVTALTIWLRNYDYYLTPLDLRPFNPRYEQLKPSGIESHGYGVAGAAMIIAGVAIYSTRKRMHALSAVGSIRRFLEVHIFLCLLGPILVLYHTTFKFGGLVAVGFWSMAAVVASGFIGRYFYRHIPRNIEGRELTIRELEERQATLLATLRSKHRIGEDVLSSIEALVPSYDNGANVGLASLVWSLIRMDFSRFQRFHALRVLLKNSAVDEHVIKEIVRLADERIVLKQRIDMLQQVHQVFHYWHVIHVPFSFTLFAILAIHIGVSIAFGYTWIF
jgi:hypothetical protein